MACPCWSKSNTLFVLFVLSATPIAYLVSLELAAPTSNVYYYRSASWIRECAKWDPPHRRFLVSSFSGGVSEISVPENYSPERILEEVSLVKGVDLAGNSSLGLLIDRPRNRVLVVAADMTGNRYGALLAYDMSTWQRLFLVQLSGPNDEKSLADDVAVDAEGNAYVTDVLGNKIWRVGADGASVSTIQSQLFKPKEWYNNLAGGLNGIVYHPGGFLLVVHTFTGNLFKVDLARNGEVKLVEVAGPKRKGGFLGFRDGMALLSPTRVVVAGNPSASVYESGDGRWDEAELVAEFHGPKHRVASAVTVKDDKVYVSHLFGLKNHALVEAVFS